MYVVRLLRVADRVEVYYVNFTQRYENSYTDDRSYTAVVEAINTLKRFHSDADYVIAGTFNVHGHEAVFRHHLPEHYAVCDFPPSWTRAAAASPRPTVWWSLRACTKLYSTLPT